MPKVLTRGMRNCNPLNIRVSSDRWLGLKDTQCDAEFFQFTNVFYGLRAAFKVIDTYNNKYRCYTVRQIVSKWAPTNENNTENYIKMVCKFANLSDNTSVQVAKDKETAIKLVRAMAYIESHEFFEEEILVVAYRLAFNR